MAFNVASIEKKWSEGIIYFISILAIIFAFRQESTSDRTLQNVRDIAGSMSTSFVGIFPDTLEEITDLVDGSRDSLKILVDYVGYGHYSTPETHSKYMSALESAKRRGVNIDILIYDVQTALDQTFQFQWNTEGLESELRSERFVNYFNVHPGLPKPESPEEFLRFVCGREAIFQRNLLTLGVCITQIRNHSPLFMWVRDSKEAIFAFSVSTQEDKYKELTFRTRDAWLISTFISMLQRTKNDAGAVMMLSDADKFSRDVDDMVAGMLAERLMSD
jgi:hypothetical protein